jgi:hypothetical protein
MHVHVPKAGGSTLRQLLNRSFCKGYYNSVSLLESRQYSASDVATIVRTHPWLRCMSDHKLTLDLPYDLNVARILALAFVRDPVERFISRYFFHRHNEEVECLARRTTLREFAQAELVDQHSLPLTNSQICFLNAGRSQTDMEFIDAALATGQVLLFPIERFDEACVLLEQRFPDPLSDLSYVRTNVSERDQPIDDGDRQLITEHLQRDMPVVNRAHECLDQLLAETFPTPEAKAAALEGFRNRCARRIDNFNYRRAPKKRSWLFQFTGTRKN